MAPDVPRRPFPVRERGAVLATIGAAALASAVVLDLRPGDLVPGRGLELAGRFFARALTPAWRSEADFVPPGTSPLPWNALEAAGTTILFAAAAMSLALVLGLVLGFLASTAWWADDPAGGRSPGRLAARSVLPLLYGAARVLITGMRSVHELLWAVLLLAAFGITDLAALLAIAIPYGGILAKVFSEMVDEAPRDAAHALRAAGASGVQVFLFGLVPAAVPDMIAYAFYRFECALRSSAVLGFFGFPTLGLYIRQSFRSTNYGEVWTYLYVLIGMVAAFDLWSGAVRRRLLA